MSLNGDSTPLACLSDSLLASIIEINTSVASIEIEKESFIEFGSYLYRASIAIMELQTTANAPETAMEILQSLSKNICLARELVENSREGSNPTDLESRSIIMQLEEVIKCMGEDLSLFLLPTSQNEDYAGVAVRSLSNEMQNVNFKVRETQESETKEQGLQMFPAKGQPKEELAPTESDLYPISNTEFLTENSRFLNMSQLSDNFPESTSYSIQRKDGNISKSSTTLPQLAQYMEPLYEIFFCPLTKKIMDDPVSIENGVTYERKAITEWFEKLDNSKNFFCPKSGQKLTSRVLRTNIALKTTIEEWKERNEVAQIKIARAALSLASSKSMVLEAIKELQSICQRKSYNKIEVLTAGMLPLLDKFLDYKVQTIRCAAVELLRQLAEDNEEGREMIGRTMDFSKVIKMFSSNHQPTRHGALLFLLELSRSKTLCDVLGSVAGAIVMLIVIKFNHSIDSFASEKADEILKNLEMSPNNINRMAKSGLLEPLLNNLREGSEEMKMEMASCLGEIDLVQDCKTYVAEMASPTLIKMVQKGNTQTRRMAFKALEKISSYHQSGEILVEAGIVQFMAKEMFTQRIYTEPVNSNKEAAAILANILESGVDLEKLQVNSRGHTITSDYIVYNLIHMVKSSLPDEVNINLIRILLCLTKFPKSTAKVASVVKESEASYTLIEFINNPHEKLGVAAMELLVTLSPYMGHTLAERLCKIRGQPENLIQSLTETTEITEKQAVSANFLAKLPHQNLMLNLALLDKNTVPTILRAINQIQRSGVRTSKYASAYLEGLVGVLVRFTTTLYEPHMLFLARTHNFTSVFTELLLKTSSDGVQRFSAIGLENLSSKTVSLSKPPQIKKPKFMKLFYFPKFLCFGSSKGWETPLCPVHRGVCSPQNTFCLVEAKAVDRLLACLDHENVEVIEAALSALCTLLDDKVDVDKSVSMLSGVHAIPHLLNVVKEHRQEDLWQKSLWVIEKFLIKGGDESASEISQDRLLLTTLVSAFHDGDSKTRQMVEKILKHLNKMPDFTL